VRLGLSPGRYEFDAGRPTWRCNRLPLTVPLSKCWPISRMGIATPPSPFRSIATQLLAPGPLGAQFDGLDRGGLHSRRHVGDRHRQIAFLVLNLQASPVLTRVRAVIGLGAEATDPLPKPEGDRQPASLRPLRGIVICAKSDFDTSDGNIPAPRPWTCFAPLIMAAVYGATNRRLTQFRQRCKRRNQSWRLRSTNPAETPIPRSKGRRG
jgi:hypothetical protein